MRIAARIVLTALLTSSCIAVFVSLCVVGVTWERLAAHAAGAEMQSWEDLFDRSADVAIEPLRMIG